DSRFSQACRTRNLATRLNFLPSSSQRGVWQRPASALAGGLRNPLLEISLFSCYHFYHHEVLDSYRCCPPFIPDVSASADGEGVLLQRPLAERRHPDS